MFLIYKRWFAIRQDAANIKRQSMFLKFFILCILCNITCQQNMWFFLICFLLFTIYTLHITSALFMLQSHYTFFHLIYNSIFLKILLNFCVQSVKSRHRNILLKLTDIPLFRNNRSLHTLFPYRYRHSFRLPGCLLHDIFFLHWIYSLLPHR